jgi:excisionase family DNA binding protein
MEERSVLQFPVKPFYSPAEVARILDVSDTHVLNLIEHGTIAAVRVSPRVLRISYGSLMRLIGQPLAVRRETLSPDEVRALRDELRLEPVPAPDHRLAPR